MEIKKLLAGLVIALSAGSSFAHADGVTYTGSGRNTTYGSPSTITVIFSKDPVKKGKRFQKLSGFIDMDGVEGNLCGAGTLKGARRGNKIKLNFISHDTDPECEFDWGYMFRITGNISKSSMTGRYTVASQQGVFELSR